MNILIIIATVLISGAVGIPVGMTIRKKTAESKISSAESEAKRLELITDKPDHKLICKKCFDSLYKEQVEEK